MILYEKTVHKKFIQNVILLVFYKFKFRSILLLYVPGYFGIIVILDEFYLTVEASVFSAFQGVGNFSVTVPALEVDERTEVKLTPMKLQTLTSTFRFAVETVELWWPNGYGKQNLYRVDVKLKINGKQIEFKFIAIFYSLV